MSRQSMIAALRELADFLEENPEVPYPAIGTLSATISVGDDADGFAAVEASACAMGTHLARQEDFAHTWRDFGPLRYLIAYSTSPRMKEIMRDNVLDGETRSPA